MSISVTGLAPILVVVSLRSRDRLSFLEAFPATITVGNVVVLFLIPDFLCIVGFSHANHPL